MTESLETKELATLIRRVFLPKPQERAIAILVDLPDEVCTDNPAWKARRDMVAGWARGLAQASEQTGLEPSLVLYRNVHTNNGDLPADAWVMDAAQVAAGQAMVDHVDQLAEHRKTPFDAVLEQHPLVVAPTEHSATAPLKLSARRLGFRGATMPGFSAAMIPALRLDYGEINRRVQLLKDLLDRAGEARLEFQVDGERSLELQLDLRYRTAHASGGVFPEPGIAGNLPSGETYIVPYEGERDGEPSRSAGVLPVELEGEVICYRIENNVAVEVLEPGAVGQREAQRLAREPAYGNLAELGLGVLDAFGVEPTGVILLDEKLGLHIAFGRSDHFGGQVGPAQFSAPEAVVHIDRVYVPRLQPRVSVRLADLILEGGETVPLMRDGRYVVPFDEA